LLSAKTPEKGVRVFETPVSKTALANRKYYPIFDELAHLR
jgi:hypothetical protein